MVNPAPEQGFQRQYVGVLIPQFPQGDGQLQQVVPVAAAGAVEFRDVRGQFPHRGGAQEGRVLAACDVHSPMDGLAVPGLSVPVQLNCPWTDSPCPDSPCLSS